MDEINSKARKDLQIMQVLFFDSNNSNRIQTPGKSNEMFYGDAGR